MIDLISRQAAIEKVHLAVFDFFDIDADDFESPMTEKDKMLLSLNKAISQSLMELPTVEPNCVARMGDDWDEPEVNPCRGCGDYDGRGGCKSNDGCGAERK